MQAAVDLGILTGYCDIVRLFVSWNKEGIYTLIAFLTIRKVQTPLFIWSACIEQIIFDTKFFL